MPEESPDRRTGAVLRFVPWAVLVLVVAMSAGMLLVLAGVDGSRADLLTYLDRVLVAGWGPVCCVIGALIVSRHRGNLIGWLLIALGLVIGLLLFTGGVGETDHPAAEAFSLVSSLLWIVWISLFALLILLFPDGRPVSPRWRAMVWFAVLWPPVLLIAALVFEPEALFLETPSPSFLQIAVTVLLVVTLVGISASALLRFARSRGVERQQLKWFAYATAVGLALVLSGLVVPTWGQVIADVGSYGPLVGIAVALFRHRLYDIDVLIGRTVVYGALVAILAGLYSAAIRLFNALFVGVTGIGSEEVLVITTLILAASFTPIKKWLEEIVERRYKKPAEMTAAPMGAAASDPAALASLESRMRAIVREELARSRRAT